MSDYKIHPTAIVDRRAQLAADVSIGAYAIIEGPVSIGAGTTVHPYVHLQGRLTVGARNVIHARASIGDAPQDRKFKGEPSETVLGDDNWIREGVTIHRATGEGNRTVVGDRNFLMVNSHVGHNCRIGNDTMIVNGALLGGFVEVGDRAIVSGNTAIHQYCRIGRLAMVSNISAQNVDVPPFFVSMSINTIVQLNTVGLRRSGMPAESINGLRRAFQLIFRSGRPLRKAIEGLPSDLEAVPEVMELVAFIRTSKRGVSRYHAWSMRGESHPVDEVE